MNSTVLPWAVKIQIARQSGPGDKAPVQDDSPDETLRQLFEPSLVNPALAQSAEVTDAFDFLTHLGDTQGETPVLDAHCIRPFKTLTSAQR